MVQLVDIHTLSILEEFANLDHITPTDNSTIGRVSKRQKVNARGERKSLLIHYSNNSIITTSWSVPCRNPRNRPLHDLYTSCAFQRSGKHKSRFLAGLSNHPSSVSSYPRGEVRENAPGGRTVDVRGFSSVAPDLLSSTIFHPSVKQSWSTPQTSRPSGVNHGTISLVVVVLAMHLPVDTSRISRSVKVKPLGFPEMANRLRSGDIDMWMGLRG